jgi:isopentenyl phosphate kinase
METPKCHIDLIVKFGGSAITDKSKLETLNEESLTRAVELISLCHKQNLTCIVVHGAGYV